MDWTELLLVIALICGFAAIMLGIEKNYRNNVNNTNSTTAGSIEYSESVLNFIKIITNSIAILKFRTFQDNHNMDKITQEIFKKLVMEVAAEVNESIDAEKINFDNTLFTKKFYETYIIDMSMFAVKSLLNDFINK